MPTFAAAGYRSSRSTIEVPATPSKPASGYDERTMAQDVQRLLADHLAVTAPVTLVGHDIGMTVAFAFAALYPTTVKKLVLVGAIVPGTPTFKRFCHGQTAQLEPRTLLLAYREKQPGGDPDRRRRTRVHSGSLDRNAFNLGAFGPEVIDR